MQIVTFGPHSNALLFWGENAPIVVVWLLFKTKTIIDAPQLRSPGGAAVCSAYRYSSQKVVSFSLIALSHSHTKKAQLPVSGDKKGRNKKKNSWLFMEQHRILSSTSSTSTYLCKSKASNWSHLLVRLCKENSCLFRIQRAYQYKIFHGNQCMYNKVPPPIEGGAKKWWNR